MVVLMTNPDIIPLHPGNRSRWAFVVLLLAILGVLAATASGAPAGNLEIEASTVVDEMVGLYGVNERDVVWLDALADEWRRRADGASQTPGVVGYHCCDKCHGTNLRWIGPGDDTHKKFCPQCRKVFDLEKMLDRAIREATTIIELERGYDIHTHKPGIESLTKLVREIHYPCNKQKKLSRWEVVHKAGEYLRHNGYCSERGAKMRPSPELLMDTVENWKRQSPFEL
jgi:hypothetical protein